MSGTQTQPQTQIELEYITWGSYGQFDLRYAILRNYTVLNPIDLVRKLHLDRGEYTTITVNVDGKEYEIEVRNGSSRKNAKYYAKVPKEIVLAVIREGASSSRRDPPIVYWGEGDIDIVIETEKKEKKQY